MINTTPTRFFAPIAKGTLALAVWCLYVVTSVAYGQSNPALFDLSQGDYQFDQWAAASTAGTYPANMVFHTGALDAPLESEPTGDYTGTYNATSGSRMNGLEADGVSTVHTSSVGQGRAIAATLGLNTTSLSNISVSWTAGTVAVGDRAYGFRLQYRVGNSGAWTDVPGPVEYLSAGKPAGTAENFGPTTLPAECNDQPELYLRWKYYYVSGSGSRPQLRIDNITVASAAISLPSLAVAPSALTGFNYEEGSGPSAAQTFGVSAANLNPAADNITITAPTNFEVSLDGSTYAASVEAAYSGAGTDIVPDNIFVRLSEGLSPGNYSGSVALSGGGASASVSVSGTVEAAPVAVNPPLFDLSQGDFTFTEWFNTEAAGTYPANMRFLHSTDPTSVAFDPLADGTELYNCAYNLTSRSRVNGRGEEGVSFIATGSPQFNNCVSGAANNTRFVGSAVVGLNTAGLTYARVAYTGRLITAGDGNPARQFALRAQYRVGPTGAYTDIPGTPEFSTIGKVAGNSQVISFDLPAAALDQAEVYVRFVYLQTVSASGSRPEIGLDDVLITTNPISNPLLTANANVLSGFYYAEGEGPSASQSYTLTGSNLVPADGIVEVAAPAGFEISDDGVNYGQFLELAYSGAALNAEVFVRLEAGLSQGNYSGNLLNEGGSAPDVAIALNGSVGYEVNLGPGDLSIIGYRSVANDGISFVNWVSLPANAVILFTDRAWTGTELLANENLCIWQNTSGDPIAPGTVIKIGGPEFGNGTGASIGELISGSLNGLAQGGDNIFALQGSITNPVWVYGLSYLSNWLTIGSVTNATSYLPTELDIPFGNIVLSDLNGQYDGVRNTEADLTAYLPLIHNTENWALNANGAEFGDFNTTPFTLFSGSVPSLTCPEGIALANDEGSCSAMVAGTAPAIVSDEAATLSYTITGATEAAGEGDVDGVLFAVGVSTVTYIAENSMGQSEPCSFTVTVSDTEAPTITAPAALATTADDGACEATGVDLGSPTTADNCGVASVSNDAPASFPLGSTTVTWTVTDVNGNTATAEQIVTVSDTEAPTITAPAAVSTTADAGACEATGVDLGSPTTADNCGVASVSNDAPASFPVGSTTVTWTVTDVNGNTATAEQTVTVSDTEAPTITCPADVSASNDPSECGAFVSFDLPEAVDNCGMVTLIQSEGDPSGSFFAVGSSTITYIATDEAGNMATCSFAVQVVDAESPMIACNQLIIQLGIQGSATLSPEELVSSAVDNCGVASFVALLTTFDNNSLGLNFVPVTATDVHGNTSTCFAEVTVLPFEGCNSIGGTISTGSNTNVCIGQGTGVLDVSLTGAQGDNSLWAVTPGNSFNVIAVRFNNPNFNFANFSPGNYRLWHLSYADDVSLAGITNGLQLEGCFDASNPIAVTVSIAIGGTITTASNTTICVGDGNPDVINAQVFGAAGDNQRWVLTDNALNVLAVRANNSNFPLDALAPGTYRIYHVAYANGVNVNGITNGNGLQGCIDVSNAITITAQNCGPLSAVLSSQPNPTAGPSVVQFSLPANERVTLEVYDLNGRLIEAIYSGEAQTNVEYRFDFDSSLLPNGIYLYRLTTASEIVVDKFMVAR